MPWQIQQQSDRSLPPPDSSDSAFSGDLKKRFNHTRITGGLIAVKGISGKTHDTAGFGDIAKIGKPGLVLDDALVKSFHWELRGHHAWLMGCVHFHQNGAPFLFKGLLSDQVETRAI